VNFVPRGQRASLTSSVGRTSSLGLPAVILAGALVLAACSAPSEPADQAAAAQGGNQSECSQVVAPVRVAGPLSGRGLGGVFVSGSAGSAPVVTVENGAPPAAQLGSLDLEPGNGAEAVEGATLTVNYCGVGLSSGAVFDSSWARGQAATFPLNGLIAGWQEGLPGMKEGGRRLLIIPGSLAYGPNPPGGSGIQPDETLAFVIDLEKVS
jgi:peptidylprolyl isomerase